eukprot:350771-Chlamydomonas_euryale.AAC.4
MVCPLALALFVHACPFTHMVQTSFAGRPVTSPMAFVPWPDAPHFFSIGPGLPLMWFGGSTPPGLSTLALSVIPTAGANGPGRKAYACWPAQQCSSER